MSGRAPVWTKSRRAAASAASIRSSASSETIHPGSSSAAASSRRWRFSASSQLSYESRRGFSSSTWTSGSAASSSRVRSVLPSSRATTASANRRADSNQPGRSASALRAGSRQTSGPPRPPGPPSSTGRPPGRGCQEGSSPRGRVLSRPKSVGHRRSGSASRYLERRRASCSSEPAPRCRSRIVVRIHAERGTSVGIGLKWSRSSGNRWPGPPREHPIHPGRARVVAVAAQMRKCSRPYAQPGMASVARNRAARQRPRRRSARRRRARRSSPARAPPPRRAGADGSPRRPSPRTTPAVGSPADLDERRGAQQLAGPVGAAVVQRHDRVAHGRGRVEAPRQVRLGVAGRQQARHERPPRELHHPRLRSRLPGQSLWANSSRWPTMWSRSSGMSQRSAISRTSRAPARYWRGGRSAPERIAAVLELDPDGVQVRVVAGVQAASGVGHPPRVPGGVLLVHELRDPAVEPDEVVRAHAALRIGEPVARGLEAPDVRVQHDARGRTAAPPALLIRGHPTFCPHREYNVRHQGMDAP